MRMMVCGRVHWSKSNFVENETGMGGVVRMVGKRQRGISLKVGLRLKGEAGRRMFVRARWRWQRWGGR